MMAKQEIDDIKEYHQCNRVSFVISSPKLQQFKKEVGGLEKKFKLSTSLSCNNYVLFNHDG